MYNKYKRLYYVQIKLNYRYIYNFSGKDPKEQKAVKLDQYSNIHCLTVLVSDYNTGEHGLYCAVRH